MQVSEGVVFNRFIVITAGIYKVGKYTYSLCKCSCGTVKPIKNQDLLDGDIKSCGCLFKEKYGRSPIQSYQSKYTARELKPIIPAAKIGDVYGRLIVLGKDESIKRTRGGSRSYWLCRCECGVECVIRGDKLKSGHTKSCGCLFEEFQVIAQRNKLKRQCEEETARRELKEKRALIRERAQLLNSEFAGLQASKIQHPDLRTFNSWSGARQRVTNRNSRSWADYGGRGIAMCDRWIDAFENFLKDMGPRPPGTTLDRIDVDGNYELNNCRWADGSTQAANTRERKTSRNENTILARKEREERCFLRTVAWG